MRRRSLILLILAVAFLLQATAVAHAWSNGGNYGAGFGTHDWVMYEGRRLAGSPSWLRTSTALSATDDPDMVFHDYYHHCYDVWGSTYGDAPTKISEYYDLAVRAYRTKHYWSASRYVGLMSHYYSDICNPIHTDQVDAERKMHSRYETAVNSRTNSYGENRAWIKSDGFQRVSDITAKSESAATYAHKRYSALGQHLQPVRLQQHRQQQHEAFLESCGERPLRHHPLHSGRGCSAGQRTRIRRRGRPAATSR